MKNTRTTSSTVVIICVIAAIAGSLMLSGCSSLKHVDATTFSRQIELNNMQTVVWSEYIGQADGKAYLLHKRLPLVGSKWKEYVWFTEVDELDSAFLVELVNAKQANLPSTE